MEEYLHDLTASAQANPAIAGVVGLVLLYLLVRKTKLFLYLLLLAAVLGGVFAAIAEMSGTGREKKQQVIKRLDAQDVK